MSSSPSPVRNLAGDPVPGKHSASEIQPENRASSPPAECVVKVADVGVVPPPKGDGADQVGGDGKDCRICHLSLDPPNQEEPTMGGPIELGCACKDDLAAAHRHCAEAWFRIKDNLTCEICGSVAHSVSLAHGSASLDAWENEAVDPAAVITVPVIAQPRESRRSSWPGHRILGFLLACMVFAFIVSWLFRFNFPS